MSYVKCNLKITRNIERMRIVDRHRVAAFKKIGCMDDLPTMQVLTENQLCKCANDVDEQCVAKPLPPGYHYGPIEVRLSADDDFVTNLMRVTVYREVRKDEVKPIFIL